MSEDCKRVKISAQLQIRIPAEYYKRYGFGSEALAVPTATGIELRPVADAADEGADLLQQLMREGFSGDDLVEEFRMRTRQSESSVTYGVESLESK